MKQDENPNELKAGSLDAAALQVTEGVTKMWDAGGSFLDISDCVKDGLDGIGATVTVIIEDSGS